MIELLNFEQSALWLCFTLCFCFWVLHYSSSDAHAGFTAHRLSFIVGFAILREFICEFYKYAFICFFLFCRISVLVREHSLSYCRIVGCQWFHIWLMKRSITSTGDVHTNFKFGEYSKNRNSVSHIGFKKAARAKPELRADTLSCMYTWYEIHILGSGCPVRKNVFHSVHELC